MANPEHLEILEQGVELWNEWRQENPDIKPDLKNADLAGKKLKGANLSGANLFEANLHGADLTNANLSHADATGTIFYEAYLKDADLSNSNLTHISTSDTICIGTDFSGAILHGAGLYQSNFSRANFSNAEIYGIAVWDIDLDDAIQANLTITSPYVGVPKITVDNLEIAQFINLLINNRKIRDVITSITSKAVLILGRFTPERKAVLDALRDELRKHDYLPILFDFDVPEGRDTAETVTLLARMARFIVADLTEPSSVPKELEAIVPTLAVPIQPLIEGLARPYSMFSDYWKYDWVLNVHRYGGLEELIESVRENVIAPAENKLREIEERRRRS